jgi:hypothetical protein
MSRYRVTAISRLEAMCSELWRKRLSVVLEHVSYVIMQSVIHLLPAPAELADIGLHHPAQSAKRWFARAVTADEPEHLLPRPR